MPPVFAHGRLRLYLLKLLDEAPRHGYEVIRLLEERFQGLYAPSAGTVYPRLAKLEAEGLVTHATEGGRKVYSITDAGRAELADRSGELADLELEIRESVAELAAEIRDDVRGAAGDLRREMRAAASEARGVGDGTGGRRRGRSPGAAKEELRKAQAGVEGAGPPGEGREPPGPRGGPAGPPPGQGGAGAGPREEECSASPSGSRSRSRTTSPRRLADGRTGGPDRTGQGVRRVRKGLRQGVRARTSASACGTEQRPTPEQDRRPRTRVPGHPAGLPGRLRADVGPRGRPPATRPATWTACWTASATTSATRPATTA